jgi:XTP/dITP diphosphohydrolase
MLTHGVSINFEDLDITEIQSDSLEEIAVNKATTAYNTIRKPVLVEDDGLHIHSLRGFPGQYSSFVYKTIGNAGVLKLLDGLDDRAADFIAVMGYHNGNKVSLFTGVTHGSIALVQSGKGWGFDPIFVPDGAGGLTYGELGDKKNIFSHRKRALDSLAMQINQQR